MTTPPSSEATSEGAKVIITINGNKTETETETERDIETLVDYRNKSTAATRKVTLEDKIVTKRDVG